MLVDQVLDENLEKSLYLHLKGCGYLNTYLNQELGSCKKELKQLIASGIDKCFKQNSTVCLTTHPSLIAYKALKNTELFKDTIPLVEDFYLIGCTFKNWLLGNLDSKAYNKIILKNHYKCYWLLPFPQVLLKVLINISSIYINHNKYSVNEFFYPFIVELNKQDLVPKQFKKLVKDILNPTPEDEDIKVESFIEGKKAEKVKYLETRNVRQITNTPRLLKSINPVDINNKLFLLRKSATSRGLDFNLDYKDLLKLYQTKRCYYTDIRFDEKYPDKKLTIDRIDRCQGYIKGNVVACTNKANQIKMQLFECPSALTYKQIRSLIDKVERKLK